MKKRIKVSVTDIIEVIKDDIVCLYGPYEEAFITNLADSCHVDIDTLDWVAPKKPNKQEIVLNSKARVLLVDETVVYDDEIKKQSKVLIVSKHPKRALAIIGNYFFVEKPTAGIHPTAIVDPTATIGEDVYIGPYCVIGKAIIGKGTHLDSNVRIFDEVTIGANCDIKSGAVLGGAGFGFERDEDGNKFRFPQLGSLIIGNDVEIGANTCIDRGALSDTIIGDHTKINNLCHIAHNNVIGKNVTITGCVNVSGSNVIDDNAWLAPNSSIRGFVHIGEKAVVGMGAVVTKDIPAGETWVGNPAKQLVK